MNRHHRSKHGIGAHACTATIHTKVILHSVSVVQRLFAEWKQYAARSKDLKVAGIMMDAWVTYTRQQQLRRCFKSQADRFRRYHGQHLLQSTRGAIFLLLTNFTTLPFHNLTNIKTSMHGTSNQATFCYSTFQTQEQAQLHIAKWTHAA
jgi:hypothetical protein